MALDPGEMTRLVEQAIPEASVHIEDVRGDGALYMAHVVSPAFRGKSRIDQHRMVYRALQDRMGEDIQALSLRTALPEDGF